MLGSVSTPGWTPGLQELLGVRPGTRLKASITNNPITTKTELAIAMAAPSLAAGANHPTSFPCQTCPTFYLKVAHLAQESIVNPWAGRITTLR